jgi:hypothetical protein
MTTERKSGSSHARAAESTRVIGLFVRRSALFAPFYGTIIYLYIRNPVMDLSNVLKETPPCFHNYKWLLGVVEFLCFKNSCSPCAMRHSVFQPYDSTHSKFAYQLPAGCLGSPLVRGECECDDFVPNQAYEMRRLRDYRISHVLRSPPNGLLHKFVTLKNAFLTGWHDPLYRNPPVDL